MIVTCFRKSLKKYVGTVQVRDTLKAKRWRVSRSFTLNSDPVGHVVSAI